MKKYYITYPLAIGLPSVATLVCAMVLLHADVLSALCFAGCVGLVCWFISRVILHLCEGDNSAWTWQLNIYVLVIAASWITAVLSATDWIVSGALALLTASVILYLGVRYDDSDRNGAPDSVEKLIKKLKGNEK